MPYLLHYTLELVVRIGIYSEGNSLSVGHIADVCLVYIGHHLHIGQVFGDGKQFGRAETCCYRLPLFYAFRQHDAIDRRGYSGISQVRLCLPDRLLCRCYLFFSLLVGQLGILVIVGAHQTFLVQSGISFKVLGLIIQRTLCTCQICLGCFQLANEVCLVEFGNNLTFLHHTIVVYI